MSERIILDPLKLSPEEKRLKEFFEQRMIGQPRVIDRIVFSYGHYLASLKLKWKRSKPIICFILLGPTGVGKTLTAELLAEYFFGDPTSFTKIIAENFLEKHELSTLLGSSAGYVGFYNPKDPEHAGPPMLHQSMIDRFAIEHFENTVLKKDDTVGRLHWELEQYKKKANEAMSQGDKAVFQANLQSFLNTQERLNAYIETKRRDEKFLSVILVDEIEKGPWEITNHLLHQSSDKGMTVLKNGEITDFTNSWIIATSNLGSKAIAAKIRGSQMGFAPPSQLDQSIFDVAMEEVERYFTPEFLARVMEDVVVCKPLEHDKLRAILDMRIAELRTNFAQTFPIELIIHDDVKKFIFAKAFKHPEFGARPLKSKLKKYLEEPLSRLITSDQVHVADRVYVDKIVEFGKEKIIFTIDPAPTSILVQLADIEQSDESKADDGKKDADIA
ncbi:MAG: ATP-dependent Clp protease ATP-binding subunit [Candidatus Niyogibacteria bacterium]|nr:ATP-dependent Clp protease ATP-binding subunit [Candidatus Niyogibacteria bacterium]